MCIICYLCVACLLCLNLFSSIERVLMLIVFYCIVFDSMLQWWQAAHEKMKRNGSGKNVGAWNSTFEYTFNLIKWLLERHKEFFHLQSFLGKKFYRKTSGFFSKFFVKLTTAAATTTNEMGVVLKSHNKLILKMSVSFGCEEDRGKGRKRAEVLSQLNLLVCVEQIVWANTTVLFFFSNASEAHRHSDRRTNT